MEIMSEFDRVRGVAVPLRITPKAGWGKVNVGEIGTMCGDTEVSWIIQLQPSLTFERFNE